MTASRPAPAGAARAPTRLVLLGHPVAHSLSPVMQRAALTAAGIDVAYDASDVPRDGLAATLGRLAAEGAAGNITIPHKAAAAPLMACLTPVAARVGAVNTFWTEDGALVGDNTDVAGFDAVARAALGRAPEALRVALIGAGGAAAAVLAAIEGWPGTRVGVWSRTGERAAALVRRFAAVAAATEFLAEAIRGADVVINATPIGLEGEDIPMPVALVRRGATVIDLVYRRGETPWVRMAKARGLRAVDGLPMLVEQGALAFTRWFGRAPDREAMWAAVR